MCGPFLTTQPKPQFLDPGLIHFLITTALLIWEQLQRPDSNIWWFWVFKPGIQCKLIVKLYWYSWMIDCEKVRSGDELFGPTYRQALDCTEEIISGSQLPGTNIGPLPHPSGMSQQVWRHRSRNRLGLHSSFSPNCNFNSEVQIDTFWWFLRSLRNQFTQLRAICFGRAVIVIGVTELFGNHELKMSEEGSQLGFDWEVVCADILET